jgi:methylamine dehydrogenase accessory protein MauD
MDIALIVANVVLWPVVLFLGFLLLGTLRALGVLRWRLDQLEATTPRRLGRDGLRPGKRAPDFTLPGADGTEVGLHDFAGRKVFLVFVQAHCGPCRRIVPDLNRLQRGGEVQLLVVNNGTVEETREWARGVDARFPVLAQQQFRLSRRYEVFATPFAFLIDEQGIVASKGILGEPQHIRYVLAGERAKDADGDAEEIAEPVGAAGALAPRDDEPEAG